MSKNLSQFPSLQIIPSGGVAEVTRNMFVYQFADDILIVDCGIGFPDEPNSEEELLLPDFSYLLKNRDKIKGLVVTHAHFDHYGAVPNLLAKINVPVYASHLTREFIKKKLKEFHIKPKEVDFRLINHRDENIKIGCFRLTPFHINHSVPESLGLFIQTPIGNLFHVTDYKFDWTPIDEKPFDIQKATLLACRQQPLVLLSDCLGAANPGHTESEATIQQVLEGLMLKARQKVLVTTVSSNISRIKQTIQAAINVGRKVAFVGRSIEESSQVARELGYFASLKKHLLPVSKIKRRNPAELCLIIAGSYGQSGSSLERVSQDKHHLLEIGKGDTVIFSADPAPPQVLLDVNRMIDNLNRLGAMVYYYEIQDNLHVSGHGTAEDVKMLFAFIKPKYFVPIGGDYRHMYAYSLLVEQMGWPLERTLLLENGQKVEINQQKKITVSAS